jgi:patatin-like phospholipase/acyl hydrolase
LDQNGFQILALDGGGIKGLYSAAVLAKLEEDLDISIVDHFDLITGTSTGGIIALGLGLGMKPREIVQFYISHGSKIFPTSRFNFLRRWWKNKYDPSPLEQALIGCFRNKLLGESRKRLVISSYNVGSDDVCLFKTPHHQRQRRDYKVPVWQIAMATSAAPTYFPAFSKIESQRLIDGGVWANNPILIGIAEAVSVLDVSLKDIKALSLGTTSDIKDRPKRLDTGGFLQWRNHGTEVIMRGQSIGASTQAKHLLGNENFVRLDPSVPHGLFSLDKLSIDQLLALAGKESRNFSPKFAEYFIGHNSAEYKPCYK